MKMSTLAAVCLVVNLTIMVVALFAELADTARLALMGIQLVALALQFGFMALDARENHL